MSSEPAGADTDATSDLHEFTVVWNQLDEFAASLAEIRAELHDLKRSPDDVEAVNDSVDTLEQRIDQLDDRMSLLELVDTSDDLEPKQRSGVLIEHLRRKARRRGDRDNNEPSKATMDREAAEDALHYPDLDRTTFYSGMERAERLIGDEDLLSYEEGRLQLQLVGLVVIVGVLVVPEVLSTPGVLGGYSNQIRLGLGEFGGFLVVANGHAQADSQVSRWLDGRRAYLSSRSSGAAVRRRAPSRTYAPVRV